MDLELSDEQIWLSEAVETLLEREWPAPDDVAAASGEQRRLVWTRLLEFGALAIGQEDGLGAVELCLISRALGSRLASVPFLGSAAVRLALAPFEDTIASEVADALAGGAAVAIAVLEPGSSWSIEQPSTRAGRAGEAFELDGEKVGVEHVDTADWLAVSTMLDDRPMLALIEADSPGVTRETGTSFDPTVPTGSVRLERVPAMPHALATDAALERVSTLGALLAAAEAIGAAGALLGLAARYAAERRQFGHTIGSFQALRHLLAGMHVREASGWSTVLYAAAAFDDAAPEAAWTASIAKTYTARAARELAHGAMQVFGGIAFTAEHPAHRFLRRIVVRERQFGDAAHHERELGRALASAAGIGARAPAEASLS